MQREEQDTIMHNIEFPFSLPTLQGNRVNLRPITPDDYPILFQWHTDLRNLYLWWADRNILSFEEFGEDFRRRLSTFFYNIFIVEFKESDKFVPIGVTYTYDTNFIDQHVYLCVYLTPDYTARGLGAEAGFLITNYMFTYYGFRKIYSEIFSYNVPSIKAATKNGFKQEGVLKQHRWFGDRYWDLHLFALYREDFDERKNQFQDK